MIQAGQIQEYLKKLTPTARGNLLTELERLEACGEEMPRCEEILAMLRAEFSVATSRLNLVPAMPPATSLRRWSRC